jgi:hypothetical protein
MIAMRIPLLALAAFSLGALAQQPAQQASATAQTPAPVSPGSASRTVAARKSTAPASSQANSKQQGNSAPAPQGNLTVQIMDDNGTPVPGAAIEVDGMRAGMGSAIISQSNGAQPGGVQPGGVQISGYDGSAAAGGSQTGDSLSGCTVSSTVQSISAQPAVARGASVPSQHGSASPGNGQTGEAGAQSELTPEELKTVHPGAVQSVGSHPRLTEPRRTEPGSGRSASSQSDGSGSGSAPSGNGQPGSASGEAQPGGDGLNSVQPGTAQSINCQGAAPAALPPGVVPLTTDAQGQLVLELPPGEHTLSVSVYGFDPWTGHFTLNGKHRQIVQIKLSTAPTTFVMTYGADDRVQLETATLDTEIPLEPVQTLVPLPAHTRRHVL